MIVRYRKRPVAVDTVQWTGHNEAELAAFTNHRFEVVPPEDRAENPEITAQVYDVLHSTWVGVYTGQHVVRGVKGEFYPIAEDVLGDTCDPVDTTFFQPGHTYGHSVYRFMCEYIAIHPVTGRRQAWGWFGKNDAWRHHSLGERQFQIREWTDVTEAGAADA